MHFKPTLTQIEPKHNIQLMKIFPVVCLIFCLAFYCGSIKAQQAWTLDQCMDTALKRNLTLAKAANNKIVSRADYQQAKMKYIPSLNASIFSGTTWGIYVIPALNQLVNGNNIGSSENLNASINLYEGMRKPNTLKEKREGMDLNDNNYTKSANDISVLTIQQYFQVLLDVETVVKAEQTVKQSQLQVERSKNLYAQQSLAAGDLYNMQSQLATDQFNLVNARNTMESDYLALRQTLVIDEDTAFRVLPVSDDSSQIVFPFNLEQCIEMSVKSAPELKIAANNARMAELNASIQRAALQPTLSFTPSIGTTTSNLYPISLENQLADNRTISLGFNLSLPLFNNYTNQFAVVNAEINYRNSMLDESIADKDLAKKIENAYHDIIAGEKKYSAAKEQLHFAGENFKYESEKFSLGMNNALTYNDAKSKLIQAQIDMASAKYDFLMKKRVMLVYMGLNGQGQQIK